MRALRFAAFCVEVECVFLDDKPPVFRYFLLAPFDLFVKKLFDSTAIDAHQMVVVLPRLDFEYGFA